MVQNNHVLPLDCHKLCCESGDNKGHRRHQTAGDGGKHGIEHNGRRTHKTKPVHAGVPHEVFRQESTGHPFRDKLERV